MFRLIQGILGDSRAFEAYEEGVCPTGQKLLIGGQRRRPGARKLSSSSTSTPGVGWGCALRISVLGLFVEGGLEGLLLRRRVRAKIRFICRVEISSAWRRLAMDPTVKVPEPCRPRPEDGIWVEPGVVCMGFFFFLQGECPRFV